MYWITKNLGTGAFGEPKLRKLKNMEFVDVRDLFAGTNNDPEVFESKVNQVEKITQKGKKAIVLCGSGVSRSNSVAMAYLVKSGMSYDDAWKLIRKKVPIQNIDYGLLDLIKQIYSKK